KYLMLGTYNGMEVYDPATLKAVNILPGGGASGASQNFGFANNGTMVVGANTKNITLWDLQKNSRQNITIDTNLWITKSSSNKVSVASRGSYIAFADPARSVGDSLIMVFDVNTREWITRIGFPTANKTFIRNITLTPDGSQLAVVTTDGLLRFYDTRTGA